MITEEDFENEFEHRWNIFRDQERDEETTPTSLWDVMDYDQLHAYLDFSMLVKMVFTSRNWTALSHLRDEREAIQQAAELEDTIDAYQDPGDDSEQYAWMYF